MIIFCHSTKEKTYRKFDQFKDYLTFVRRGAHPAQSAFYHIGRNCLYDKEWEVPNAPPKVILHPVCLPDDLPI